MEYTFYIAIFVLSNEASLFTAVTLGIFSVTHCCVVAVMYKVPAQLFIINGYLCEIQSGIHCPKLHPDFDESCFTRNCSLWVRWCQKSGAGEVIGNIHFLF